MYQAADDDRPKGNKFVFLLILTFLKRVARDVSLDVFSRNTEELTVALVTRNKVYNIHSTIRESLNKTLFEWHNGCARGLEV